MPPTYILAPNFSFHPNTSICLGDIVEYPDDPTKPLSSVPESELKQVTRHFDYDNELSSQNILSLRGSIWAKFLEKASAKIGGGAGDEQLTKYTIRRLETVYFTKQPTDEEAAERVKEKKVKTAVNAGLLKKKPVFMITGLKIARGFQLSKGIGSTTSANTKIEIEVPVASDVGIGAETNFFREKKAIANQRTGNDIVFAYQLHIITHKRRGLTLGQKDVDITVFKAPAAFLSTDQKRDEEESVDVEIATESVLCGFDQGLQIEIISPKDGEEGIVCLAFGEA